MQKQIYIPKDQYIATKAGIGTLTTSLEPTQVTRPASDMIAPVSIQRVAIQNRYLPCIEIAMEDFTTLTLTEDTLVSTQRGLLKAKELEVGDQVDNFLSDTNGDFNEDSLSPEDLEWKAFHEFSGRVLGYLIGHGTIRVAKTKYKSKKTGVEQDRIAGQYVLTFSNSHNPDKEAFFDPNSHHPVAVEFGTFFETPVRAYVQNRKHKLSILAIPRRFFGEIFWTKKEAEEFLMHQPLYYIRSYLKALFTADAGIQANRIRISQSDLGRLQRIKVLLARFGIYSRITRNGAVQKKEYEWKADGEVVRVGPRKEAYFLVLEGVDLIKFRDRIGLEPCWRDKVGQLNAQVESRQKLNRMMSGLVPASVIKSLTPCSKPTEKAILTMPDSFENAPISVNGFKCYF